MERVNLHNIGTSFTPATIRSLPAAAIDALYVHVPFCVKKCRYCDFYSLADRSEAQMRSYVECVLEEARWWSTLAEQSSTRIDTVYFGGGTPSMLPIEQMERLVRGLRSILPMAEGVEWTIEANPATIDLGYCQMLRDAGVNRLSIGAQSFVARELETLGRVHDAEAVRQTVTHALAAGFERLSIDLIYAVPGQTLDSWRQSLETAMELGLRHVSCYCLTLEEETPMWRMTRQGRFPEVAEEMQLEFMRQTRESLGNHGLQAYEISNYATPGEECRHNLHYWRCDNYLGLGPGAASHVAGRRWRNSPNLRSYVNEVPQQRLPVCDVEMLSLEERIEEALMMMLRTREGVDRARFRSRLNGDIVELFTRQLARLESMGLLEITPQRVALSERGTFVADEVIGELLR